MTARPAGIDEVAEAAAALLRELLPDLEGPARFDARVAVRLLEAVAREARLGPQAEAAEAARLRELLGEANAATSLPELRAALCARMQAGPPLDEAALARHLRQTAAERLAIDSPAYRWRADAASG